MTQQNRFINAVAKMQADLDIKLALREQLLAEHRATREREEQEEGGEDDASDEEDAGRAGVVAGAGVGVSGVGVGVGVTAAAAAAEEYYGAQAMDIS